MDVSLSYINCKIGLSLGADEVIGLLKKMQLGAELSASGNNQDNITVFVVLYLQPEVTFFTLVML